MTVIEIQPAPYIDHITNDGHECTKLPYPFFVNEDGTIGNQGFWRGEPFRVVGFQRDLAKHQIDVWWDEVAEDPTKAVGLYVVTSNRDLAHTADATYGVHETAIIKVVAHDTEGDEK